MPLEHIARHPGLEDQALGLPQQPYDRVLRISLDAVQRHAAGIQCFQEYSFHIRLRHVQAS